MLNTSDISKELNACMNAQIKYKVASVPYYEPEAVIRAVCSSLGVDHFLISMPGKSEDLSDARKIICYILRTELKMTLKCIGNLLGRDHSTVISALTAYEQLVDSRDKIFAGKILKVSEEMEALCA